MENNELATTEQTNSITTNSFREGIFTTVDQETVEGRKSVLSALNNAGSLAEIGERILKVRDIVITGGVRKARAANQADTPCVNVYLITDDGAAYMTQSDGIARSVQNILSMFPNVGRSVPEGYLEMQVVTKVLSNGNTMKSLDVL